MSWPDNMEDALHLQILNELPLRVVLQLRAVNRQWKEIIETQICKGKKSLKLFGSVKALLDYYQMVNIQEYNLQESKLQVNTSRLIVSKKKALFSCNRAGCACRHLGKQELTKNFRLYLPAGSKFFPNFKLPEDDHLIFSLYSTKAINLLLRLFPAVEHLVIYHIGSFNERYFRLPFLMLSLKSLELYEKSGTSSESAPRYWANLSNERVALSFRPAHEDISASYRYLYTRALSHIEELTLDGVFLDKYCLWELLLKVEDNIALKRLKLSRFSAKQLMSSRVLKAVERAKICLQLTHLTVDSLGYDLLDFFIQKFPNLVYLDIGVEHGVKSYDLLVSIFNCKQLTELRLRSTDNSFLTPIKLNYIFKPFTFPAVKKLHLYISQMNYEKLCLLTKRVFPTVQELVVDIGHN